MLLGLITLGLGLPACTTADASVKQAAVRPDNVLLVCAGMAVSNAPAADAGGQVKVYRPYVRAESDVSLMTAPVKGACLSSGYGPRRGRHHRGVDYDARRGEPVYAAGDGTVLEARYHRQFGNMVVLDHGSGVYTRYAHLANLKGCIRKGAKVIAGTELGQVGETGTGARGDHLHFEILKGDYDNPKGSFGLAAVDPFAFPAAAGILVADNGPRVTTC
jgi:murein DD-endopeptidase MepM/ murein hydrolase activator NlpD